MNVVKVARHSLRGGQVVDQGAANAVFAVCRGMNTWLDFMDIVTANAVFADALFERLAQQQAATPALFVGLLNVDNRIMRDLVRSLNAVREQHGLENLGYVVVNDSDYQLIGHIQETVVKTWQLVKLHGTLTTAQFKHLDGGRFAVSTYSTYLIKAHNAHLLVRSGSAESGFVYKLPPLPEVEG